MPHLREESTVREEITLRVYDTVRCRIVNHMVSSGLTRMTYSWCARRVPGSTS